MHFTNTRKISERIMQVGARLSNHDNSMELWHCCLSSVCESLQNIVDEGTHLVVCPVGSGFEASHRCRHIATNKECWVEYVVPFKMALLIAFCLQALALARTNTFYVVPKGRHAFNNEGKFMFTDLQSAIQQAYKMDSSTVVINVQGVHTTPLQLDSTSTSHPHIIIQSDPASKERATLSGGVTIPASAFKPTALPSGKQGGLVADLFALGLNASDLGTMGNPMPHSPMHLYVDNEPMVLARDPNIANDKLKTWMWAGYEDMMAIKDNTTSFILKDNRAALWAKALQTPSSDVWLHGYWKYDWRDTYVKIISITNSSNGYIVTRDVNTPPQYPWVSGCRFYAVNSLHFLDTEGEYYIDRSNGMLYYLPPDGVLNPSSKIVVSVQETIITSTNQANMTYSNLDIGFTRGTAFSITGANNITIVGCSVMNGGGVCLSAHGSNVNILNNTVHGCGNAAIDVGGGDRQSLTSANNTAFGNTVYDFSRLCRTYNPGIGFDGVGLYVGYNNISDGPHTCILGGGNNNLFEYNTITHCSYECTDTGAFYTGRSWSQRGNVARFNTFDTIRATERLAQKSCSQNAFYLDDEMSGWEFYGNIIKNSTTGVLLGGGRHNKVHGNVFINNDADIHFDNRGMNWQAASCKKDCNASMGTSCFRVDLEAMNYTNPPYSVAYPEIVSIYDYYPCVPVGNVIMDNKYCHQSNPKALFIDATPTQVNSWLSVMSDNLEDCSMLVQN
eukprot:m.193312 g.193312  ORF g.193312 m.193312 type:complete len:730 (-) comp15666_c0_seq7:2429-4618(-)